MTITAFNYSHLVKTASASLKGSALLRADVNQLLGVTNRVAASLKARLNVASIFDLATSRVFNSALELVDPKDTLTQECARHGLVPADLFDDGVDLSQVQDIGALGLEQLNLPDSASAADLKEVIGVETIRDLAFWTPFQTARGILASVVGKSNGAINNVDPESPLDLIPSNGNYPVERVYFQGLHLVDTDLTDNDVTAAITEQKKAVGSSPPPEGEGPPPQDAMQTIDLAEEGELDLMQTALLRGGFTKPAVGVAVTSEQSWYAEGVTLGELLHSMPLAPGESTRIAVIDWNRATAGDRKERVGQTEDTTSDTAEQQAINEVTNAVAKEIQTGYSRAQSDSTSQQSGGSTGLSLGSLNFGGSGSNSRQRSLARGVSRSSGTRNLSSRMHRNLQQSTHQHATSARARRAAVVQETSAAEGEKMSTRVVTNYNHMHALSVQYYETVQVYRVVTRATRYDRHAFIPLKPFDFKDFRIIEGYRSVLEAAALTKSVKDKLRAAQSTDDWVKTVTRTTRGYRLTISDANGRALYTVPFLNPVLQRIEYKIEHSSAYMYRIWLYRAGYGSLEERHGDRSHSVFVDRNIPANQLAYLNTDIDNGRPNLRLTYYFHGGGRSISYEQYIPNASDQDRITVARFNCTSASLEKKEVVINEVINHLNDNAIYYSRAIWASLSAGEWTKALSGFRYRGESIGANLDPTPSTMVGNYVAFPWRFSNPARKLDWLLENKLLSQDFRHWMKKKGYLQITDQVKEAYLDEYVDIEGDQGREETRVPMPAGGVFAEAVLGRANSAEKLDLNRFWNWKDSPIPIVPTEINPLKAGNRGAVELLKSLKAQGLAPQTIHLHTEEPAPSAAALGDGMTASAMKALAASNIFRDMSNAAGMANLAQQGLTAAQQGATEAEQQATESGRITAEQMTQNMQIMNGVVQSLLGSSGAGGGLLPKNPTNAGAALNAAEQLGGETGGDANAAGEADKEADKKENGAEEASTSRKEDALKNIVNHWQSTTAQSKTPKGRWRSAAGRAKVHGQRDTDRGEEKKEEPAKSDE